MIRIKKPAAPPILKNRGSQATKELCEAYVRGDRKFKFDNTIYGAKSVKNALRHAQHGKCAFCESKFAHVAFGDVEHFRPKGGYHQKAGKPLETPGYYWLAYEWSNLFASCQLCNQRHKKNLFPLENPDRRAKSHHHRIDDEKPLLIDCGAEDPETLIGFREEYAFAIDGNIRGNKTITILQINRQELVEARRTHLKSIEYLKRAIDFLSDRILQAVNSANSALDDLQADLKRYRSELDAFTRDESAYSSMARSAITG